MKAIALANQQGQTIYTITKDNYSEVLPNLNHGDDVMTDIRNAVYANKEVTVHQSQLNFKGWTGSGYIILDPKTGVGGYMLGGGVDGGFLALLTGIAQGAAWAAIITSLGIAFATLGPIGIGAAIVLFTLIMIPALLAATAYSQQVFESNLQSSCLETGFLIGGATTGILGLFKNTFIQGIMGIIGFTGGFAWRAEGFNSLTKCFE